MVMHLMSGPKDHCVCVGGWVGGGIFFFFFFSTLYFTISLFPLLLFPGHGKFETLGALGISCMLLATAGGIAWHAFDLLLVCPWSLK